jgi:hypothetical protein
MVKAVPCHVISRVGDGNVTSIAVGNATSLVNVTENESAWATGAPLTTRSASTIHNDFRIFPFSRGVLIEGARNHFDFVSGA